MNDKASEREDIRSRLGGDNNVEKPLVFKTSTKTEASIDWTMLKISFQDLQTLQDIMNYNKDMIENKFSKWSA